MKKALILLGFLLYANVLLAQVTIKGGVYDVYLEPLPYASLSTGKETKRTDKEGSFSFSSKQSYPIQVIVSAVGYETRKIDIENSKEISIVLKRKSKLNEVIVSASRTAERILESPVTIERIDVGDVKNTTSLNFYEGLANLKSIDILSSGANIKNIVSNRGYANTENTRFVQLVDGVESTIPLFNYSLGNGFGISELDIYTAEILPGASSALYGPNALNGIITMHSKSPFVEEGISTYLKSGATSQEGRNTEAFYDVGIRMAHAFNGKFAGKVNFTYQSGEEWHATDYRNKSNGDITSGDRNSDFGYDGVNVYGDDVNQNIIDVILVLNSVNPGTGDLIYRDFSFLGGDNQGILSSELLALPNVTETIPVGVNASRNGYNEIDLIGTNYKSANFSSSLHYRPWENDKLEIIYSNKFSLADNIIHGNSRLKETDGLSLQHAIEFKGSNFFVKGYYTKHTANLVDPTLMAHYINNQYIEDSRYFVLYSLDYVQGLIENDGNINLALGVAAQSGIDGSYSDKSLRFANVLGLDTDELQKGAPKVGTARFERLKNEATNLSVLDGGASLKDESGLFHVDANYNFHDIIDFVDIQVGGSFRDYQLNSNGEIFTDLNSDISYKEFGIYTQFQKKIADDKIKLAITGRFDKSKNFNGNFSPRASVTYAAGSTKQHNFRLSFQTGFRNPTSQDQYASIDFGDHVLLGTTQDNIDRYSGAFDLNTVTGGTVTLSGQHIIDNSFTSSSVDAFLGAVRSDIVASLLQLPKATAIQNNINLLEKANIALVKPETVRTLELGYRGATKLGKSVFEVDGAIYYSEYKDLITQKSVITPSLGTSGDTDLTVAATSITDTDLIDFIVKTNSAFTEKVYGFNVGIITKIFGDFDFGVNYSFTKNIEEGTTDVIDEDIEDSFNTPENSLKVGFGHDNVFKNFGFNVNVRWQDEFLYNSVFVDAIIEERTLLDAQVNYSIPSIKSTFKVGATNIGGNTYTSVPGSGLIGSQYYLSWTINN